MGMNRLRDLLIGPSLKCSAMEEYRNLFSISIGQTFIKRRLFGKDFLIPLYGDGSEEGIGHCPCLSNDELNQSGTIQG